MTKVSSQLDLRIFQFKIFYICIFKKLEQLFGKDSIRFLFHAA